LYLSNYVAEDLTIKYPAKLRPYLAGLMYFITGYLIRPEAAIGTIIISGGYFLIRESALLKTIRRLSPHYLFAIGMTTYFGIQMVQDDSFTRQVEPDIEYQILAKGNLVPLSEMTNAADSARYMMAQSWIVNDPEHISIAFLRSIIGHKENFSDRIFYAGGKLGEMLLTNHYYSLLIILILMLTAFLYHRYPDNKEKLRRIILFYFFITSIVVGLTVLIKMEGRVWIPITLISLWLSLSDLLPMYFISRKATLSGLKKVFAVSALLLIPSLYSISCSANAAKDTYQRNQLFTQELNNLPEKALVLLDISAVKLLYTSPFKDQFLRKDLKILIHNLGTLSLTQQYSDYLRSYCHCDPSDYAAFYNYLYHQKERYIIGYKYQLKLTEDYLKAVYELPYKFTLLSSMESGPGIYDLNLNP
jgi:hypothetical protein